MAIRNTVNQGVQIGVEVTPGTAVAANRKLNSLSIELSPGVESSMFRAIGNKLATVQSLNKEWATGKLSGVPTYDELPYIFNGILVTDTPTAAITAQTWNFQWDGAGPDTYKTFTVEQGDSVRAHRAAHMVFTEFGITYSRSGGLSLSGSLLGSEFQDAITMTATPTTLPLIPVIAPDTTVLFAPTMAGLDSATYGAIVLDAEWKLANRFGPVWDLDSSKSSWGFLSELVPNLTGKFTVNADADGMSFRTSYMQEGTTLFSRYIVEGAVIETGINYTFQIDQAWKVTKPTDFSDKDGVYAIGWELEGTIDNTSGLSTDITLINTTATL